jgi:hypothetical protein
MDYQWYTDTASMTNLIKDNDGYRFFILVIDIFSVYVWTALLRTTSGLEMVGLLRSIFVKQIDGFYDLAEVT